MQCTSQDQDTKTQQQSVKDISSLEEDCESQVQHLIDVACHLPNQRQCRWSSANEPTCDTNLADHDKMKKVKYPCLVILAMTDLFFIQHLLHHIDNIMLQSHSDDHQQEWACGLPKCPRREQPFNSRQGLRVHVEKHFDRLRLPCPIQGKSTNHNFLTYLPILSIGCSEKMIMDQIKDHIISYHDKLLGQWEEKTSTLPVDITEQALPLPTVPIPVYSLYTAVDPGKKAEATQESSNQANYTVTTNWDDLLNDKPAPKLYDSLKEQPKLQDSVVWKRRQGVDEATQATLPNPSLWHIHTGAQPSTSNSKYTAKQLAALAKDESKQSNPLENSTQGNQDSDGKPLSSSKKRPASHSDNEGLLYPNKRSVIRPAGFKSQCTDHYGQSLKLERSMKKLASR